MEGRVNNAWKPSLDVIIEAPISKKPNKRDEPTSTGDPHALLQVLNNVLQQYFCGN